MSTDLPSRHKNWVLVRVSPEILDKLATEGSEPVVILGVDEQADGTYDMTLQTAPVDPELVNHRAATARIYALLERNITGMVPAEALREALRDA